jgi:ribosome-associated protein
LTSKTTDTALTSNEITDLVISSLEDLKAIDIQQVDVTGQSPLTDRFVIATGNSSRHVKSMAENLILKAKSVGCKPLGTEGQKGGEWVLVDLNDVIVHLMLPQTRAFYNLEKLWEASSQARGGASRSA